MSTSLSTLDKSQFDLDGRARSSSTTSYAPTSRFPSPSGRPVPAGEGCASGTGPKSSTGLTAQESGVPHGPRPAPDSENLATTPRAELGHIGHTAATSRDRGAQCWGRFGGCRLRRALLGFLIATLAFATFGCSDASKPSANASSSAAVGAASSSAPLADPKADAQASLDKYWAMVKRLSTAPDPTDPEIDLRAVDPSASAIRDQLTTRKTQGEVAQYDGVPYSVSTSVAAVSGSTATFSGCIVDGARVVVASTGQVVDDKVSTSSITGSMVLVDGAWKVQRFDVLKKVEGEVPCDSLS